MPRPPSRTGLDDSTQRELCWWLAKGCGPEDAAKRAGLSSSARLYHFAKTREFAVVLREALQTHLNNELAPKAVRILDEIMSDTNVTPRVRVDAAKALLDRAGLSAATAGSANKDIPLNEMSIPDLHKLVEELETQRAAQAKVVSPDGRPGSAAASPEVEEMIE